MDFYKNRSILRILLILIACIALGLTTWYTIYLGQNIAKDEEQKVKNLILAMEYQSVMDSFLMVKPNCSPPNWTFSNEIMRSCDIPMILVTETGEITLGNNFGDSLDFDIEFLTKELNEIQLSGRKALTVNSQVGKQYIYYKNSTLRTISRYYPFGILLLVSAFLIIGLLGYRSQRDSEQNRVWAGLAKETAHQLGTPISGIVAWMEHLKLMRNDDKETMEIVDELGKDVDRLVLVADRFSKIGSEPELKEENIVTTVFNIFEYMERRAPKRLKFIYPQLNYTPHIVRINPPLFEWVLENLLRNALDASGKQGFIKSEIFEDEDFVYIDISDTGKGIPESKFNSIFKPGFTTKKRGWGLGLSLARRIIESYHSGKIFVKESTIGEGTTFRIQLPKK